MRSRPHGRSRRRTDESGAVVLLVVAMTLLMFGIAALVVDLGHARLVKREAQAAADASALAAGNALYLSGTSTADTVGAVAAAKDYAASNFGVSEGDWAACTDSGALAVPDVSTSCISFDHAVKPSQARVVVPARAVDLAFATAFDGPESIEVNAVAQAKLRLRVKADCGLCITGNGYHDFQNGDAYISGGDVAINGSVNIQNNGLVSTDGKISVEGTATGPLDGYSPDPLTGQPPVEDPLADVVLPPSFSGLTVKTNPCGLTAASGPGIYGARNFGNDACTLQPGLYVVTGQWDLSGNATVVGTGVTLYFTCGTPGAPTPCAAPGQPGGWLDAGGNGGIALTAPMSGPTKGLAVVYDRLNTADLEISGNGASLYSGTVYANSARMRYDGNGCAKTSQSLIIVRTLEFNGNNACLRSQYDAEDNAYVPPDQLHLSY